jgi:hypothetical protein
LLRLKKLDISRIINYSEKLVDRLLSIKGGKPLLPGSRGFFFLPVPDEIIKVAAVLFNQSALQF